MPSHLYGQEGDESGQHPDAGDGGDGPTRRHPHVVVQRVTDVDVAIEADGAQVEDGGGGEHHVERDPDEAKRVPEQPPPDEVISDGEGHHQQRDEGVGHGEGHDEEVTRLAKIAVGEDGDAHEHVAGDGEEDDSAEEDGNERRGRG